MEMLIITADETLLHFSEIKLIMCVDAITDMILNMHTKTIYCHNSAFIPDSVNSDILSREALSPEWP